jgi:hypothetical protein
MLAVAVVLWTDAAWAHELWFHPGTGGQSSSVRLTFGDSPDLGEAERVAEIAHAKVWADGKPLEVERLPDALEARLLDHRPAVISAFADRGIVNYMGDSFVIYLAAYSQTRAIEATPGVTLGLGDDQVRLLLISRRDGPPVVQAVWRGRPAVDAPVKLFHGHEPPTELRTNRQGEISCPDLREGPWSLLVEVRDKTPGKRDGRDYSHIRYKATLAIGAEAALAPAVAACLVRVKEIHGATGPWAVAGYRIGERALKDLGLPRQSHDLEVVHRCPAEVQYSCIADGVQAATGASPGKLNLRIEPASRKDLCTMIRDKKSGRILTFTLKPEFAQSITDRPFDRLEAEGRRVATLPDEVIFQVGESK